MSGTDSLKNQSNSSTNNELPLCLFSILAVWVCSQMEAARTRCKVDASSQPEKTWLPFGILSCNGEEDQTVLCQQSHCTPSQSSAACLYSWQRESHTSKLRTKAGLVEHTRKKSEPNFCILDQSTFWCWSFLPTANVNWVYRGSLA